MFATSTIARTAAVALSASAMSAVALTAAPATASGGGGDVRNSGACSGSTHWKMKAKGDDALIEVEAEIDSNRSGQTWGWRLKDNGDLVASGSSRTGGASGSFSVARKPADKAGTDHFVFRAVYAGEVCRATVSR